MSKESFIFIFNLINWIEEEAKKKKVIFILYYFRFGIKRWRDKTRQCEILILIENLNFSNNSVLERKKNIL